MIEVAISRIKELLIYDPETGIFIWRVTRARGAKAGSQAGSLDKNGYVVIGIDGRNYRAHRLAWAYEKGEWPVGDLDHEDRDHADNRIAKLRPASRSQNMANSVPHRDSSSGLKGIFFDKRRQRWASIITKNGRRKWLGYFDTAASAHAAYCLEAEKLFGEFARAA